MIKNLTELMKEYEAKYAYDLEDCIADTSASGEITILFKLKSGLELSRSDDIEDEVTDDTLKGFSLECALDDQIQRDFTFPLERSQIEAFLDQVDERVKELEDDNEEIDEDDE